MLIAGVGGALISRRPHVENRPMATRLCYGVILIWLLAMVALMKVDGLNPAF